MLSFLYFRSQVRSIEIDKGVPEKSIVYDESLYECPRIYMYLMSD